MKTSSELGVIEVAQRIHLRLQRYLEAQYHIRDSALIDERRCILEEPGGISQRPFVEVTPSYSVLPDFSNLKLPSTIKSLLADFTPWRVGVFPPYKHQADALEAFFEDQNDLIVATGTGSGKTETFLYSILGALALEGSERPTSFKRHGIRALLLYPMNALVSDQTARLRRLFGHEKVAGYFREKWKRHPYFGMYTSRTPYPGERSGKKDKRYLEPLVGYYETLATSSDNEKQELVRELKDRGRWPAKDIVKFFAREEIEKTTFKTGKKAGKERTVNNWSERFWTDAGDRELFTRHEMQSATPDILVTNYSMLEYMLLRPIERSIFSETQSWLASDKRNQLLLVLDEAHMYRGVGGAEVGLLLRRLLSRLDIGRDRLRCILTSASLGADASAKKAAMEFAVGLTGTPKKSFTLIRGTREPRAGQRPGTTEEGVVLSKINAAVLARASVLEAEAFELLRTVSEGLRWPTPPSMDQDLLVARQYVCKQLTGFGPLELLVEECSGNASEYSILAKKLFPTLTPSDAEHATDGLLALGAFARRVEPGRAEQPLLPTRVHLLFRGLPPLYVCVNQNCSLKRSSSQQPLVLGRMYTEPLTNCKCGGRVFELLTHRDCGAAFLRVFGTSPSAEFYWHERGGILSEFGTPLHETHVLLEEPHPHQQDSVIPIILDVMTGRVLPTSRSGEPGTRLCYRPEPGDGHDNSITSFGTCPVCTRRTRTGSTSKIMDLATKGEQPFANLVREQFVSQLASKPATESHPNEGRKALLFSDGRQKAARLARDLPREVERDSFREALALAASELANIGKEAVLDETVFGAFVAVCARFYLHFFDGDAQKGLIEECSRFRRDYKDDLALAIEDGWRPLPSSRYRVALLRQISDPYYSLVAACAAVVEPRRSKLKRLEERVGGAIPASVVSDITRAWIYEMLSKSAFDPTLNRDARLDEFPYFQGVRDDSFQQFFKDIQDRAHITSVLTNQLRTDLFDIFTRDVTGGDDSGRLLITDGLILKLALDSTWLQCSACGHLQISPFLGGCSNCGDARLESRPPEHQYMVARKGYFREPLRQVLKGERPVHITAEEHTAQLSQRDASVAYATTEEFELRFQDVPIDADKPPVDILSCTTTMEVGIDIGSLTAVGLRTVPPQRENYQQRAGRAGRRGTSVSSVLTFAQGGQHDAYYFANPHTIISGAPREPRIKIDNRRLARRHIHSHLLQTYFHKKIDAMPRDEQQTLSTRLPGIMSAFGTAQEFFGGSGVFSHKEFDTWIKNDVLVDSSNVVQGIASWLPKELAQGKNTTVELSKFVRDTAGGLRIALNQIGKSMGAVTTGTSIQADDDDAESVSLLDILFANGILPSYAFPTDLCSFVIQEWADHGQVRVKERPQLSRVQALSEYAPGRLLVVNKQTYRVGGLFLDVVPTSNPAASLFAGLLTRYVGCPRCTFVRLESGSASIHASEGTPCPVCQTPIVVREFICPPGFSPERGKPVREGDREQDITYASSAQLPELVDRAEFEWKGGAGANLEHSHGEDVLLVVANKGKDNKGFSICESCGASWIDGEEQAGAHPRPFLLPIQVRTRENAPSSCGGTVRRGMFLGHEFRTDILLLRIRFRNRFDFSPNQPWLYDALATLSEALALGASLHLDIDPGELSAGFRLLPPLPDQKEHGISELYLFDTASGGAGYAAEAGIKLSDVLAKTEQLLTICPANCERSCTKCLRHYGNRFLHSRLDRRLAHALLTYARDNQFPAIRNDQEQSTILSPLGRLLSLEGWKISTDKGVPLKAMSPTSETVVLGVYPALLQRSVAESEHSLKAHGTARRVLLPDYLIEHDLPAAYQTVLGIQPTNQSSRDVQVQPVARVSDSVMNQFPIREFRSLGTKRNGVVGTVTLNAPQGNAHFASRIPSARLAPVGFRPGAWTVLREFEESHLDGEKWIVAVRTQGNFAATGEAWTIARIRRLDDGSGRLQLAYGAATASQYRPDRVASTDIVMAATVVTVCV